MGTRSRIGLQKKDGRIESIYCHWDGYPEGVGKVLLNNYKDEDKVKKLLKLGDMSSLGSEPVANPKGWDYSEPMRDDMCVTYATRGEYCPSAKSKDLEAYAELSDECWGEYTYLFKDNEWYLVEEDDGKYVLHPLKNAIK